MLDPATASTARRLRQSLPCAVELPAGAGKTHLIAACASQAADAGQRVLILTHTNAGVDALRRRLRSLGVRNSAVRVRTIDGWCFNLVRHVPQLAGIDTPNKAAWVNSVDYQEAAARALRTRALREVLRASYEAVLVDEYQDCVESQHYVTLAIAETLPTGIFGDPLQGLFSFGENRVPRWAAVLENFAPLALEVKPWRWKDTNPELGRWLLDIRSGLKKGMSLDLRGVPGLSWEARDTTALVSACFRQPEDEGPVVALGKFRADCVNVARRLRGTYSVMEELEGKVMLEFADVVDAGESAVVAEATVEFAAAAVLGVADAVDKRKRRRLAQGKPIGTQDPSLQPLYAAINALLTDATPAKVHAALSAVDCLRGTVPYCREAWWCVLRALEHAGRSPEISVRSAVTRVRDHSRIVGRRPDARVVSRPLLVKGLEYNHVVVMNADTYGPRSLYVALTRARKSIVIFSQSPVLAFDEQRSRSSRGRRGTVRARA